MSVPVKYFGLLCQKISFLANVTLQWKSNSAPLLRDCTYWILNGTFILFKGSESKLSVETNSIYIYKLLKQNLGRNFTIHLKIDIMPVRKKNQFGIMKTRRTKNDSMIMFATAKNTAENIDRSRKTCFLSQQSLSSQPTSIYFHFQVYKHNSQ